MTSLAATGFVERPIMENNMEEQALYQLGSGSGRTRYFASAQKNRWHKTGRGLPPLALDVRSLLFFQLSPADSISPSGHHCHRLGKTMGAAAILAPFFHWLGRIGRLPHQAWVLVMPFSRGDPDFLTTLPGRCVAGVTLGSPAGAMWRCGLSLCNQPMVTSRLPFPSAWGRVLGTKGQAGSKCHQSAPNTCAYNLPTRQWCLVRPRADVEGRSSG